MRKNIVFARSNWITKSYFEMFSLQRGALQNICATVTISLKLIKLLVIAWKLACIVEIALQCALLQFSLKTHLYCLVRMQQLMQFGFSITFSRKNTFAFRFVCFFLYNFLLLDFIFLYNIFHSFFFKLLFFLHNEEH